MPLIVGQAFLPDNAVISWSNVGPMRWFALSGPMIAVVSIVGLLVVLALVFFVLAPRITRAGRRRRGPQSKAVPAGRNRRKRR